MSSRKVVILGSTGSVGTATLDLFQQSGLRPDILALVGGRNVELLAAQALEWRPRIVVISDVSKQEHLIRLLEGSGIPTAAGLSAVIEAASMGADWVMSAIVGSAGLAPTLAAAKTGAVIALANKESLVCAGPALLTIARESGGTIIPVDSEHSAIFQVYQTRCRDQVARLILTASGGPFRTWTLDAMRAATPEQAVAHPNWSMGAKISVDSATMMNKGLEMIEACYLFDQPQERLDVVVHPQSIIHSLVEYKDGSTLAQLGPPDMRTPIACAFAWPDRMEWPAEPLDLARQGTLTFEAPDLDRFPALGLARQALISGGSAPAAMSAANEVAVEAFLDRRIGFLDIATMVSEVLSAMTDLTMPVQSTPTAALEFADWADAAARRAAHGVLEAMAR
jgi:1-deoxy-D-xylulose-5-phosphate reductoisomerase